MASPRKSFIIYEKCLSYCTTQSVLFLSSCISLWHRLWTCRRWLASPELRGGQRSTSDTPFSQDSTFRNNFNEVISAPALAMFNSLQRSFCILLSGSTQFSMSMKASDGALFGMVPVRISFLQAECTWSLTFNRSISPIKVTVQWLSGCPALL